MIDINDVLLSEDVRCRGKKNSANKKINVSYVAPVINAYVPAS